MRRQNNDNKNLFWYGVQAKVKSFFGGFGMISGALLGLIGFAGDSNGIGVFGLIVLGLSIWCYAVGKSQRFAYKQQSGSMIHKGDW